MNTKPLSRSEYKTKYWTLDDIVLYFVNHKDPQPDNIKHEVKLYDDTKKTVWSLANCAAFAWHVIYSNRP